MNNIKKCFVVALLLSGSCLQASAQKFDKAARVALEKKQALAALKDDKSCRSLEVQAHLNEFLENCAKYPCMSDTYLASFSNTVLNRSDFKISTFDAVKYWEAQRKMIRPYKY